MKLLVEPVSLSGDLPHPDYRGWGGFLETCELRDEIDGVRFYGKTNCNYIVFPRGELIQNFGVHGELLMSRIRKEGGRRILTQIQHDHAELVFLVDRLTTKRRQ